MWRTTRRRSTRRNPVTRKSLFDSYALDFYPRLFVLASGGDTSKLDESLAKKRRRLLAAGVREGRIAAFEEKLTREVAPSVKKLYGVELRHGQLPLIENIYRERSVPEIVVGDRVYLDGVPCIVQELHDGVATLLCGLPLPLGSWSYQRRVPVERLKRSLTENIPVDKLSVPFPAASRGPGMPQTQKLRFWIVRTFAPGTPVKIIDPTLVFVPVLPSGRTPQPDSAAALGIAPGTRAEVVSIASGGYHVLVKLADVRDPSGYRLDEVSGANALATFPWKSLEPLVDNWATYGYVPRSYRAPRPNPEQYKTWRCLICKGPAHPATGAQYGEEAVVCWSCTKEFWKWVRAHTSKRPSKRHAKQVPAELSFYEAAGRWRDR